MTIDTQKPIVSRETQQLIDLCTAVAQGARDRVPELQAFLVERQQGLALAWENFAKMIEKEPEEFTEARKGTIEAVEAQYQFFAQSLDKVGAFAQNPSPALYDAAVAALQEASPTLRAALMTYEMSILSAGSSKYPAVNLFENLSRRLRSGELPEINWKATCQGHQQFYQTGIDEIDKSKAAQEVGVPERRAALMSVVDACKRLEAMGQATAETEFDSVLRGMSETFLQLEAAVNAYNSHTMLETPTASLEVNKIIHAFHAVRDQGMPVEILREHAATYQETVRKSLEGMQTATRLPAENQSIAEEMPKMVEAMEAMDEALDTIKQAAEPWSQLEPAIEALKDAVGRLSAANTIVKTQTEMQGKVLCPACQTPNAATAKRCEKCNRQLPQFTGSDVYGAWTATQFQTTEGGGPAGARDMVISSSMKGLYDATEGYEKGKLTQEEFLKVLHDNEERVRRAEETLSRTKLPTIPDNATEHDREIIREFMDHGNDAVGLLAQGVGDCMAGLMQLEKYAREDTASDMRDGLKLFMEGCHKLQQIERVAKAFVDALPVAPEGGGGHRPGGSGKAPALEETNPSVERPGDGPSLSDEVA